MAVNYEDIKLNKLSDIIGTYAENIPSAVEFATAFFSQNVNGSTLYLRGKNPTETYEEAYNKSNNDKYYFLTLESKDIDEVTEFNDIIVNEMKLQFFSSDQDYSEQLKDRKLVYFYYGIGNPSISCEGAITGASFSGDVDLMIRGKKYDVLYDGDTFSLSIANDAVDPIAIFNDFFTDIVSIILAYEAGVGWGFDISTTNANVVMKISVIESNDNSLSTWEQIDHIDSFDMNVGKNPTLINTNNSITFCMKPYVELSCEGAIDNVAMKFEYSTTPTEEPIWFVEVYNHDTDELLSQCDNNTLGLNINIGGALIDGSLSDDVDYYWDDDGFTYIQNKTENNLKLRVLAYGSDGGSSGIELVEVLNDNPTTTIVKNLPFNYEVHSCLSATTPVEPISCEGATSSIVFSSSGDRNINSGYNIAIEGQLFRIFDWVEANETEAYLKKAIETLLGDKIDINVTGTGFGTRFELTSKVDYYLPIELGTWNSATDFQVHPDTYNPSLVMPSEQTFQFCLAPYGYRAYLQILNISNTVNPTFNITVDGVTHTGLVYSGGSYGSSWADVPVIVRLNTENNTLFVENIGTGQIKDVSISSPDIEFTGNASPDGNATSWSNTVGTGYGNEVKTRFLEYVGSVPTSDEIHISNDWIVNSSVIVLGSAFYLENGMTGTNHNLVAYGRKFNSATEMKDFFMTFQIAAEGNKTLSELTGFVCLDDMPNYLRFKNTNLHESTFYIYEDTNSGYDGMFPSNPIVPNIDTLRIRDYIAVMRMSGDMS